MHYGNVSFMRKKIASIGHTLEVNEGHEELQWYTYNNIYEIKRKILFQNKELKCVKMIQAKILKILLIIESAFLSGYSL